MNVKCELNWIAHRPGQLCCERCVECGCLCINLSGRIAVCLEYIIMIFIIGPHGFASSLHWMKCNIAHSMQSTMLQFWFDKNSKQHTEQAEARKKNSTRWPHFIIIIMKGIDWQIVNQKPISVISLLWNCTQCKCVLALSNWNSLNWVNASKVNTFHSILSCILFSELWQWMMDGNKIANIRKMACVCVNTNDFKDDDIKLKAIEWSACDKPSLQNRRRRNNKKTISFEHFNGLYLLNDVFLFCSFEA